MSYKSELIRKLFSDRLKKAEFNLQMQQNSD